MKTIVHFKKSCKWILINLFFIIFQTLEGTNKGSKFQNDFDDYKAVADLVIESSTLNKRDQVDRILKKFKEKHKGSMLKLNHLAAHLRKTSLGAQIVAQNPFFEGINIMLRNYQLSCIGVNDVLRNILEYDNSQEKIIKSMLKNYCLDHLKKAYEIFQKEYWKLVENNIQNKEATLIILSKMKKKFTREDQCPGHIKWNNSTNYEIPCILAHLFAYWTLKKMEFYKEAKGFDSRNRQYYLQQPHAAHIIAIMRILGIGGKKRLNSHLIQIEKEEGRPLVVFGTAVTLAVLGFDVSCVWYSEYLLLKDYNEFMPLIRELGLGKYIHYTTINSLCESIINEKVNIRSQVIKIVKNSSQVNQNSNDESDDEKKYDSDENNEETDLSNTPSDHSTFKFSQNRARIILLDEVDLFLSRDFYGSFYAPTALLQAPCINSLLQFVWTNRKNITCHKVKFSTAYKRCIEIFRKWKGIIDQAVIKMVADVENFDSIPYILHNKKLYYREKYGINKYVNYQYRTTFACFYEKQNITKESLTNRLGIYLNSGIFSYASALYQFDRILGVTATLDTLAPLELRILKNDYHIKEHTYMPRLYGASKLCFLKKSSRGLKIVEKQYYPIYLKKEIEKYLGGVNQKWNEKRAVIVFFDTLSKLYTMYSNEKMEKFKENIIIMTADLSLEEKNRSICKAVRPGSITFITKHFARDIDFLSYDPIVNKNGGIHLIITFFPKSVTEETKILGHTAKRGKNGSVSMLLEQESLEHLITKKEINSYGCISGDFYSLLNERRRKFFDRNYQGSIEYVSKIKQEHKKIIQFTKNLYTSKLELVKNHLLAYNTIPEPTRTIILVDGTSSMGNLLSKMRASIQTIFYRINTILSMKKNSFALQFAIYRNYSAPPNMLLQVSSWEFTPEKIVEFMNGITPSYGWGNEAIEIGLAHVLQESNQHPIDQVILIGDMPPNTKDQVTNKRNKSKTQWENQASLYRKATYYEDSLHKIKLKGIPIHAFHIPPNGSDTSYSETEKIFSKIATSTGGKCWQLKIDSNKGKEELIDIICIKVLEVTSSLKREENLINTFNRKCYV